MSSHAIPHSITAHCLTFQVHCLHQTCSLCNSKCCKSHKGGAGNKQVFCQASRHVLRNTLFHINAISRLICVNLPCADTHESHVPQDFDECVIRQHKAPMCYKFHQLTYLDGTHVSCGLCAAGFLYFTHCRVHLPHDVCLHPLPVHVGLHSAR